MEASRTSTLTLFPSIFLLATVYPIGAVHSILVFYSSFRKDRNLDMFMRKRAIPTLIVLYSSIVLLTGAVSPSNLTVINLPDFRWFPAVVFLGLLLILIEFLAMLCLASGRAKMHGMKRAPFEVLIQLPPMNLSIYAISGVIVAFLEEMIFRQMWITILTEYGLFYFAAVAISSFCYSINHLPYGRSTVLQKFISGNILGYLYVISGSMIVPGIVHASQNVLLIPLRAWLGKAR